MCVHTATLAAAPRLPPVLKQSAEALYLETAATGVATLLTFTLGDAEDKGCTGTPAFMSSSTPSHFLAGSAQERSWLMQLLTICANWGVENTCSGGVGRGRGDC